jgi:hypothetical protein
MEKDTLKDDREDFSLCKEAEEEQRKVSQDDLEFALLEKQWNETDKSAREDEGRPCLTINRLPAFAKQVLNDAKLNRAAVAVKPVGDGATKDTARIQSDLIRNIEVSSQADSAYDAAFQFAVYCGFGYFRINVDYACDDAWDQDISVGRIGNPFSVYGDYEGKEATSIDWNRAYVTDWWSKAAFEAKWGKDRKAGSFEDGSADFDQQWFSDKRIRVAERWIREEVPAKLLKLTDGSVMYEDAYLKPQDDGLTYAQFLLSQGVKVEGERMTRTYKVKQRLITGTDILEENDWLGKYIPIVPMYGEEVNVNGKRHFISLIRRAKDPQRMFNYHRTSVAEQLANASRVPWLIAEGQVTGHEEAWQRANRVALPYLTYTQVDGVPPPMRQPYAGVPIGDMQAALADSDDMKSVIGIFDAGLGQRSNETSGKAIIARQREGDVSTFNFIDNRNKSVEHGGRIMLDLIPHYYTVGRILRCVQEDGETYTVPVNTPVAKKQDLAQFTGQQQTQGMDPQGAQSPQEGPPEYEPIPEDLMPQLDPQMQAKLKAITKIFDLTTGKYDVVVTAGPSFTTKREESANQMMEFIRVFPQAAPLIGDLLAKSLDWPGSEQIATRLKAMLPPQAAGQVPPIVQQLQQMLQQQDAQAKQAVAQLQQQIGELTRQLNDKDAEQAAREYDAKTKRISEVADAATKGVAVVTHPMTGEYVAIPATNIAPQQQPEAQPQISPMEIAQTRQKDEELAIKARDMDVREYEAQTKRLTLLAERLPPEAFQMLIMKTTGEAMSTTLESAEDDPMGAMAGQMAGSMPMAEPEPEMPMEQEGGMPQDLPVDQQTMPPDGMTQ